MPIVDIEEINSLEQITKIRSYDIIEFGDYIYCCKPDTPNIGDNVATLDPSTSNCIIAQVTEVNKNHVTMIFEGRTFTKHNVVGAFHTLCSIARLSDVEEIRLGIQQGCKNMVEKLREFPALTWSILYSKKFTIERSSGDISITCKVADGYISATVIVGEENSVCKFSYSAKHETIEKKLSHTLAYQLFGEELIYIRNNINALVSN